MANRAKGAGRSRAVQYRSEDWGVSTIHPSNDRLLKWNGKAHSERPPVPKGPSARQASELPAAYHD